MLVPAHIEKRLLDLEGALDNAHIALLQAEDDYQRAKADFEIGMARSRMSYVPGSGRATVQQRDDQALLVNEEPYRQLLMAEAVAKGARANITRLRAQVDIVRSLGAGLRASMDVS